ELSLGEPQGTFHIKLGFAYLMPHVVLLFVAVLGFAVFWAASPGWKTYVSAVVFVLFSAPFIFAIWKTLPTWFDELKVYKNGIVYKSRRGIQSCRWDQIKNADSLLDTGNRLKITSIEKRDGEKITFAYKMRGLDLIDHIYA